MTIPSEVQNKILVLRSYFNDNLLNISNEQENYKEQNGRYWQGLRWTHGEPYPDAAPGHTSWEESGYNLFLPDISGVSLQIHEYVGPNGTGWMLVTQVLHNGITYGSVWQSGPEVWQELPWQEVSNGT